MLGGLFVAAGAHAILHAKRYAAQAEPLADQVAPLLKSIDSRLPTEAKSLVQINGVVQVGAGLMLATGTAPRPAAAVLAGTLIPATVVNYPFWTMSNGTARREAQLHFAKNLGLLGGLLLAAADTAGSPSLSWRTQRALRNAKKKVTTSEN
ncbi:hypothetical protein Rhe02_69960 [Rhizocola hellebori]|uniref:DoxX family protein n=1 Tax=Rhizocola hellebori TaxID=1392758 RepID=A0A8J3QFY4_9ACTN|nr:hypothetical protein Rhe02_69960 [Rhizocola hellebori]